MTDDDFAELGKQIWLMEQAGKASDLIKLVEADLALPRDRDLGVGAAAHGADLAHDLAADPRLLLPLRALRSFEETVEEHRELLAALQTRDPVIVLAQLERHIDVPAPPAAPKVSAKARRA